MDGSLRFEVDNHSLQPGQMLVIYARDVAPGQPASALAVSLIDGKIAGCEAAG